MATIDLVPSTSSTNHLHRDERRMTPTDENEEEEEEEEEENEAESSSWPIPRRNRNQVWIRGVNLGGWLMAERFITPYLFAVNSCHLQGDLCWYPGQVGMPATTATTTTTNGTICNLTICKPILSVYTSDANADFHPRHSHSYPGYPIDELTLGQVFVNKDIGRRYMERHWDTFVTKQDIIDLKQAGVTHLRVPMGYWIRGDVQPNESWIHGGWKYFVRLAHWCRQLGGISIWADLHGAPGSENGFDNSGHYEGAPSCTGWESHDEHIQRTLNIIQNISTAIVDDGISDVVTGFGLLNEPFMCDMDVLRRYYNAALEIVRSTVGTDMAVFIGDNFNGWKFNDGWWTDDDRHHNTYLDSHPYHVFFEHGRAFTPRQHIAYVCRHNAREVAACCYEDPPANTIPARGISRIIGEWSAAYDMLPTAMAPYLMKTIAETGIQPYLNRTLSPERMAFLRNFVEAQMVTYEAAPDGVSAGWLFWNFKME